MKNTLLLINGRYDTLVNHNLSILKAKNIRNKAQIALINQARIKKKKQAKKKIGPKPKKKKTITKDSSFAGTVKKGGREGRAKKRERRQAGSGKRGRK